MDYLYCNKGLVTINERGDPIILKEGDSVTLNDAQGNRLFAHQWESDGEIHDYQQAFTVSEIIDNALVLTCSDFNLVLAIQTGLDELCVAKCDGKEYSNSRILTVQYGLVDTVQITPNTLLPEKKDNMALAE